jgi:subtilisin-like proprotein convertase family protein
MGPAARSNGASLSGIVADFRVPQEDDTTVHVESTPNLAIPDDQPGGVASSLTVSQAGKVKEISVGVDIRHTFIGDLEVTLRSPSGRTIVLHDRTGASANDLVGSYSSLDHVELSTLIGQQPQGEWALHVRDFAALDTGTLRRWDLDIALEPSTQVVRTEVAPALIIPDNDPAGVTSGINVATEGIVRGLRMNVDITHTFIGDLRVELTSPSGQTALLHDRSGGSRDNLITTYDSISVPALAGLIGESIEGSWLLRVTDLAGRDVGKVNRWSLELSLQS